MSFLTQSVPPNPIVTLTEVKEHLRVDTTDEDALHESLRTTASRVVEERVGKALGAQTWVYSLWGLSGTQSVKLPVTPVTALTSVTYYDEDDVQQTLDTANFYLFKDDDQAFIEPKSGNDWPSTFDRPDAISITFAAGFTTVPENLKQAALLLVGLYDLDRAAATSVKVTELPLGVESLINLDRVGWIGG